MPRYVSFLFALTDKSTKKKKKKKELEAFFFYVKNTARSHHHWLFEYRATENVCFVLRQCTFHFFSFFFLHYSRIMETNEVNRDNILTWLL